MNYKCELPEPLGRKAIEFAEFANGAAQATVRLRNGDVYKNALISNSKAIVALRGYHEPPFKGEDVAEIYQSAIDKKPKERSNWEYWDKW